MDDAVEKALHSATKSNHLEDVLSLLKSHPDVNVNWTLSWDNNNNMISHCSLFGNERV